MTFILASQSNRAAWLPHLLAVLASLFISTAHAQPFAYVSDNVSEIKVVNLANNAVTTTISGLNNPRDVAVTTDGLTVFVAEQSGNTIAVISTASNTIVKRIRLNAAPVHLALTPNNHRLFVQTDGNAVLVIDVAARTLVATTALGQGITAIAPTPDGTRVFAMSVSNAYFELNAVTGALQGTQSLVFSASSAAVTPNNLTLVAANGYGQVSLIDLRGINPTAVFNVRDHQDFFGIIWAYPNQIVFSSDSETAYFISSQSTGSGMTRLSLSAQTSTGYLYLPDRDMCGASLLSDSVMLAGRCSKGTLNYIDLRGEMKLSPNNNEPVLLKDLTLSAVAVTAGAKPTELAAAVFPLISAYGQPLTVVVQASTPYNGTLITQVDKERYPINLVNGVGSLSIRKLDVGTWMVKVLDATGVKTIFEQPVTIKRGANYLNFSKEEPPGWAGSERAFYNRATAGAPHFSSSTPDVCQWQLTPARQLNPVGVLTLMAPGTCTITASHPGSVNYLPIEPITRSFTVAPRTLLETEEQRRIALRKVIEGLTGRELSETDLAAALANFTTPGGPSLPQLAVTLYNDPAGDSARLLQPLTRLYFAAFKRVPDREGLNFWFKQLQAGRPMAEVAQAFATSAEFVNTRGVLSDGEFVDALYANTLGRKPDVAGRAYHLARLATTPRGLIMVDFSESEEYRAAIDADVLVVLSHSALNGFLPDPNTVGRWANELETGRQTPERLMSWLIHTYGFYYRSF